MSNIYLILFAKITDNFWRLTIFEKFWKLGQYASKRS